MFEAVVKLAGDAGIPEVVRLLQEDHRRRIRALGRTWAPPVPPGASELEAELRRLVDLGVEPLLRAATGEHELRVVYTHPQRPGVWIDPRGVVVGEPDPAQGTLIRRAHQVIAVVLQLPEFYAQFVLVGPTAPLVVLVLENERAMAAGRYELSR